MADNVKISQLPGADPLTGAELVPIVQSGTTKQTTLAAMPYVPAGASAVTTTVQTKLRETVSVKDFGAVGDGVADDRAAIQAAVDFVAAQGGGKVLFPFGLYRVGAAVIIKDRVVFDLDKSTIRLANGANDDVIRTPNFYSLVGTNNFSDATPNGFEIYNGIIDGNSANQSPANPDTCNGLALYAYGYILRDLNIKDARGHGIRREWGQFGEPTFGMESHLENIVIRNTGRHGIWDKGPHDSHADHIRVINASLETDDTYDAVRLEPWGNGRWFNLHVWSTSPTTNRPRFAFNNNGGLAELIACHLEGARRQLRSLGNTTVTSSLIYANFSNNPQIELSGESNTITSTQFVASVSFPKPTVLRLGGDSLFGLSNIDMEVRQRSGGVASPLVDVVSNAGNNNINLRVVGHDNTAMLTGSFDDFDSVSIVQEFPTRYTYLQSRQAPAFATTNNVRQFDYGSFTPTVGFATAGDLSVSYAYRIGRLTRIGNMTTITMYLEFTPTFTTASGNFFISGFPASTGAGQNWPVVIGAYTNINIDAGRVLLGSFIGGGTGFMNLFQSGDNTFLDPLDTTNFTSGVSVIMNLTATYEVTT